MTKSVNRFLEDKAMDHIDHALGRLVDPMAESYRNYFAIDANSDLAAQFRASPLWGHSGTDGQMAYFHVTAEGRRALKSHLRQIGDRNRVYLVTYQRYTDEVIATSAAKAKYAKFLDLRDCFSELSFSEFCRSATVRVAA